MLDGCSLLLAEPGKVRQVYTSGGSQELDLPYVISVLRHLCSWDKKDRLLT
jgi:hypothetical protein